MFHFIKLQRWFKPAAPGSAVTTSGDTLTPHQIEHQGESAVSKLTARSRGMAESPQETTIRLARIWEKLLGVESIGLDDNYFDLGGDSSLTIQLFFQIEKEFGVKVPIATLFDAPTVRELGNAIVRSAIIREPSFSGQS